MRDAQVLRNFFFFKEACALRSTLAYFRSLLRIFFCNFDATILYKRLEIFAKRISIKTCQKKTGTQFFLRIFCAFPCLRQLLRQLRRLRRQADVLPDGPLGGGRHLEGGKVGENFIKTRQDFFFFGKSISLPLKCH